MKKIPLALNVASGILDLIDLIKSIKKLNSKSKLNFEKKRYPGLLLTLSY